MARQTDSGPVSDPAVDGGLAAAALAVVLALARRRDVRVDPASALAGGVGALVLEWVLGRRPEAVRRHWDRPGVKAGSLLAFVGAVAVGSRIDEERTVSVAAGGLVGYLVVLGLVAAGALDPSRARDR